MYQLSSTMTLEQHPVEKCKELTIEAEYLTFALGKDTKTGQCFAQVLNPTPAQLSALETNKLTSGAQCLDSSGWKPTDVDFYVTVPKSQQRRLLAT